MAKQQATLKNLQLYDLLVVLSRWNYSAKLKQYLMEGVEHDWESRVHQQ